MCLSMARAGLVECRMGRPLACRRTEVAGWRGTPCCCLEQRRQGGSHLPGGQSGQGGPAASWFLEGGLGRPACPCGKAEGGCGVWEEGCSEEGSVLMLEQVRRRRRCAS